MGAADTSWMIGPAAASLLSALALCLAQGCAGASWTRVLQRAVLRQPAESSADAPPSRVLVLLSAGLALPLLGASLLAYSTNQESQVQLLRAAFGPLVYVVLACPILFVVALCATLFCSSARVLHYWEALAAGSSLVGVVLAGAMSGFLTHPAGWVETRGFSALLTVPVLAVAALRLSLAAALGSLALSLLAYPKRQSQGSVETGWLTTQALLASAWTTLTLVAFSLWISQGLATDPWLGVPSSAGAQGGRAARYATVAIAASVSLCFLLSLQNKHRDKETSFASLGTGLALCILTMVCAEQARTTAVLPWAAPGLLYANGTAVEQVRTARRSPLFDPVQGHSREWLGSRMFEQQCRCCHEAPSLQRSVQERGFPQARLLLEQIREADQYASPYRDKMPPLLGADSEIDALARWLCGQP